MSFVYFFDKFSFWHFDFHCSRTWSIFIFQHFLHCLMICSSFMYRWVGIVRFLLRFGIMYAKCINYGFRHNVCEMYKNRWGHMAPDQTTKIFPVGNKYQRVLGKVFVYFFDKFSFWHFVFHCSRTWSIFRIFIFGLFWVSFLQGIF